MTEEPQPPEGDPETWDQMAARVAGEHANIVNVTYAAGLAASMGAYISVGFSHEQAFRLTLEEHRARMEMMTSRALMATIDEDDSPDA